MIHIAKYQLFFLANELIVIPAWISSNNIFYKAWKEIANPFPSFTGAAVEVWQWISNFIPQFTGHMTYLYMLSSYVLVNGALKIMIFFYVSPAFKDFAQPLLT